MNIRMSLSYLILCLMPALAGCEEAFVASESENTVLTTSPRQVYYVEGVAFSRAALETSMRQLAAEAYFPAER